MATPEPTHRWYQYSLRLLLLLFVVVALLCSLGSCTHWLVSVVLGSAMLIGGIAGRVIAGTRCGFVQGAVFAVEFLLIAGFACVLLRLPVPLPFWDESSGLGPLYAVLVIVSLIGGIVGGFTVRPR